MDEDSFMSNTFTIVHQLNSHVLHLSIFDFNCVSFQEGVGIFLG